MDIPSLIWVTVASLVVLGCGRAEATDSNLLLGRSLAQSDSCITSTVKGDYRTTANASDPLCLHVGEFSVYCDIQKFPGNNCACPTLNLVNKGEGNLLGCYDPAKSACNTASAQWTSTPVDFGYNGLIEASGPNNVGACWYTNNKTRSIFGTEQNALLPSAAAVKAATAAAAAAVPAAAAPAAPPPSPSESGVQGLTDSDGGKIAAIICSIVGPTFAVLVWLSVTFSHREEKHNVTCGVIQHIAFSDITGSSAAAQARSLWSNQDPPMIQPSPQRKFPFKLPLTWAAFSHPSTHSGHSAFLSGQPNASDGQQGLNNGLSGQDDLSSSIQLAGMTHTTAASGTAGSSIVGRLSPSMQSGNLISASRSPATAYSHNIHQGDPALQEVRKIAAEITARCLRRWDSLLAIRAGKDSLGRQAGVWKDKFESVRSAALLLAFRMVNTQLQRQALRASPGRPDPPGSLMEAWQLSNHHERGELVSLITRTLQDIPEEEAQALPNKDPEPVGWHDKMNSMFDRWGSRLSLKGRRASNMGLQQANTAASNSSLQV